LGVKTGNGCQYIRRRLRALLVSERQIAEWTGCTPSGDINPSHASFLRRRARQAKQSRRRSRDLLWRTPEAEGQINRLKTLKPAMYGRPGVELLRAHSSHASSMESNQELYLRDSSILQPQFFSVQSEISSKFRHFIRLAIRDALQA